MLLYWLLASLALLSLALTLWQWLAAARFPLHRREPNADFSPAVTLLKPLKGCDSETRKCLASWFQQDYRGPLQILFGVASPEDSVCSLVQKLIEEHPMIPAQLVICPLSLGPNPKISNLMQLEPHILHDVVIISDADVFAPADFLQQTVLPLRDSKVGLVNCFYRLEGARNLAMRWEAFAVNGDFWSQVLQARMMKPLDFAMGAVMVTRGKALQAIGGCAALVDYLADDYQLGNKIARSGGEIAICPVVVDCLSSPISPAMVWAHQTRWARTIRVCQPFPYFLSILSNATLWPLLWLGYARDRTVLTATLIMLLLRALMAAWCEWKLTRRLDRYSGSIGLLKDVLQVFIWAGAFVGSHITWRGQRFRVRPGGKLTRWQGSI
ncbi:MAG TPA: glycosyltransferase [Candidatus Saccharimonadales bacterium]|nr:glycosyltransferase [Candidatus Saccharimonadales bacterium]